MKRFSLAISATALAAALAPTSASAAIVELGATASPVVAPSCPTGVDKAHCTIILTESTALETLSDGVAYPTTVKKAGRVVAFTVGLAKLTKADISGLDSSYGGTSQVGVTVLRPQKPTSQRFFRVVDESPLFHVQPWFGHVVQFPLNTSLAVKAGDVIGLTVPTWAPVLSINLPSKLFQYRASRPNKCTNFNLQTAQLSIGDTAQYRCFYVRTRVQYTATEVVTPVVPKGAIK
jgi:hypothetical protein